MKRGGGIKGLDDKSSGMEILMSEAFRQNQPHRISHRIQIDMFRPIRVDHTNCLQVSIKTHSTSTSWRRCTVTNWPHDHDRWTWTLRTQPHKNLESYAGVCRLSCRSWRQTVRWGGSDVWRLTTDVNLSSDLTSGHFFFVVRIKCHLLQFVQFVDGRGLMYAGAQLSE
jgi:hypothetical protein